MQGSGGEVCKAQRDGILVRSTQAHVAVVVATQELVGEPEVQVEQAAGAGGDVGGEAHALEQLSGALPLPDA